MLDATSLFSPGGGLVTRAAVRTLLAGPSPFGGLLRVGRAGVEAMPADRRPAGPVTDEGAVCRWLRGEGPRPAPVVPPATSTLANRIRPRRPHRTVEPNTLILKIGLHGWGDPVWHAFLRGRPDVGVVAWLEEPLAWNWPEYAEAAEVASTSAALAALSASARAVLVPDETARQAIGERLATAHPAMPLSVAPLPSALAGGVEPPPDPALAAVPFFVLVDGIEARANTAFILQLWRAMLEGGGDGPRLILAGERGRQIQEAKPLLDWNERLAAHVVEAPHLPPAALRRLVSHSRAVLAPGFAGLSGALLRDVRLLGTPAIVSDTLARAGPGLRILSPIDGPGWRAAIVAAMVPGARMTPQHAGPDRDAALGHLVERMLAA